MKINGIYKIQSKSKPKRVYIGSAVDIQHRWDRHLSDLRLNKHHSIKFQRHYNKYGESDLVFIIVELCFPEFLTAREQYYINKLKPYFNICKIAGSSLGRKFSEETRQKMNKYREGRPLSEETKRRISESQTGRKHSDKTKRKISESHTGKHHTEETKEKCREATKGERHPFFGKHLSEEHKQKISEANKGLRNNLGKKWSEESKKRASRKRKGRRTCPEFTPETREKIRLSKLGNKNPMFGKYYDKKRKIIASAQN